MYVFAASTCLVESPDLGPLVLREGDVWAADDPLVLARSGLFTDTPPGPDFPRRTVRVEDLPATAPARRRLTRVR